MLGTSNCKWVHVSTSGSKYCISIITLNGNGINASIGREELNRYKTNFLLYAAYNILTWGLRTHTDWSVKEWEKIFYENGKIKDSWHGNTYIRQKPDKV